MIFIFSNMMKITKLNGGKKIVFEDVLKGKIRKKIIESERRGFVTRTE
jgi:hypothetical protein